MVTERVGMENDSLSVLNWFTSLTAIQLFLKTELGREETAPTVTQNV